MNLSTYGVLLTALGSVLVAGLLVFITFAPLTMLVGLFGLLTALLVIFWGKDDDEPPYPGVAPSGFRLA